jgi:para-aminobenzoate synthetase/4-amino-4-deoxychorismate lyase
MEFSLLETMRLDEGALVRLERHLSRLEASARRFDVAYDEPRTRAALAAAAGTRPSGAWRVRLLVSRDGTPTVECAPYVRDERVWRVAFASSPVDARDPFLYNKTTNRIVYEAAKRARPDVDEVLLWNARKEVTEATIANVVVDLDGARCTPPVECGLLAGVFRAELLAGGQIQERVLTRDDVTKASRVWLINSLREWVDAIVV